MPAYTRHPARRLLEAAVLLAAVPMLLGIGDKSARFRVYIGNRPAFHAFSMQSEFPALMPGELRAIGLACGNGWRKVFNVYAKLIYALSSDIPIAKQGNEFLSWQAYRDLQLLQTNSDTALCFTYNHAAADNLAVHIIMGRAYAKSLQLPTSLVWLDNEFAIAAEHNIIVCPYFDYRQLSNVKIIRLVELIQHVISHNIKSLPQLA